MKDAEGHGSDHQARDRDGKFSGSGHIGEQGARQSGRYPVTKHQQDSVASRTGKIKLTAQRNSGSLLGNLGKAALGVAGTLVGSALRSQGHGGRR